MELKNILLFILCFISININAQSKTESFNLTVPMEGIRGSLYRSIKLLDLRPDPDKLGIVQKGALNKKTIVVAGVPLGFQFSNLLNRLNGSDAGEGELLLVLRQFSFAELTGAMSEHGYFHFRANLFSKDSGGYRDLAAIDTVVDVWTLDVTQKMFREGSKAVTEFISTNLGKVSKRADLFSIDQLIEIDSIEKAGLQLYKARSYSDGLYYSYRSFAKQQPDEIVVSIKFDKKNHVKEVSYKNSKGRKIDIRYKLFYAVVFEGKPYISGEFSCYPLQKKGNDFYFIGKAHDPNGNEIAAATIFFGIMGGLMASSVTFLFEMKIDHLSGGFIRVREINPNYQY